MKLKKLGQLLGLLLIGQTMAHAALQLELTQGISGALPVAVVPFAGDPNAANSPLNISSVIQNDLKNSGRFKLMPNGQMTESPSDPNTIDYSYWKGTGVDDVVVGSVKSLGGNNYQVSFGLVDVYKGTANPANGPLVTKTVTVTGQNFRVAAHQISDLIYQQLTGVQGIFSTRIAYVLVENQDSANPRYLLEVADYDGYNPRPILISNQPIMSPDWSPDGSKLAYVSFENQRAAIYISDIASGSRQLVSSLPGMNNAPAFSPDGSKLALVLSKTGVAKIYVLDLGSRQLTQVTTGPAIDTEPSWSPDGSSLLFTSNRDGGPEIYRLTLASGQIQRMTYNGPYNATASFSADGSQIVLLHQQGNAYNIAVQDVASGSLSVLTQAGDDSSPSLAPNGKMVLFASGDDDDGVLGMVSTDGAVKLRIPAPEGSVREAAWSPFLG